MKKVTILRGIPGSGKSTYIKINHPKAVVVSADHYFTDDEGNYRFDPTWLKDAHQACLREFTKCVHDGCVEVVVDNTNVSESEIAPYYALAEAHNYKVEIVTLVANPDLAHKRNVHGVPKPIIDKMHSGIFGLPPWWNHRVVTNNWV